MHRVFAHSRQRGFLAILVLLLLAWFPEGLSAQSKLASRLPANTIAYWGWNGSAGVLPDVAKNHLLQLAMDPKLAPVWVEMSKSVNQGMNPPVTGPSAHGQPAKPGLGLAFPDVVSLIGNPLVFGAVELSSKPAAGAAGAKAPARFGVFLAYDATGQAERVEKLKGANPQAGPWTSYDFHGMQVETRTTTTKTGTDVTYRAQAGNYFLMSDQKAVIEDLIGRFGGGALPASSLAERPEFQEVAKYIGPDSAIEVFFRLPDISRWNNTPGPQAQSFAQIVAGLHLEKIHAGAGSVSFAGEATEVRGAVLGDTSAGSLFDILGDSRPDFVTQQLGGMGISYGATRVNWAAGFHVLQAAVTGSLDPKQAATVTMGETMAQAFSGMPIEDALKLFTGEMGSVSSYSDDGTSQQVYAVAIQKPEAVLRILRAVGGKLIVSEDSAGTTTYLDIAYPYRDPATGTQRRKFYYVGVSPDMMLVAPRKAMLRQAASLLASHSTAPAGVLANPEIEQLRKKLPEKLTAVSATDLTQIPWDRVFANLEAQAEAGAKTQATPSTNPSPIAQGAGWLKLIPADAVSRHVHASVGGWWKDANGVYLESYIQ